MRTVDALVVGAGPAGSATAAALARAGVRVMVVDRARHPRPKACAEYASPRIVEELVRLGLPPGSWTDTARPLDGMELHVGRRSVRLRYADRRGPRRAWGLDRRRFDALLADHAGSCGAELLEGTALVDRHDGVARLRTLASGHEEAVRATWVVGADGARSTTARLLGVETRVAWPRRLGLVAHHAGIEGLDDHGEMHVGEGFYVGLAPLPGGELNVGMALPMDDPGSARQRFEAAIARLPAVAERLRSSRRVTPIRGAAPIGHRVTDVAGDGWLLVGDAAGFVDPFTGEGIHRALRSARAAAEAIVAGGDVADGYRRHRHAAFAAKSALGWLVQGFLAVPPLLEHAVARLGARPHAALRLGSALGDLRPATDALAPRALVEVLRP